MIDDVSWMLNEVHCLDAYIACKLEKWLKQVAAVIIDPPYGMNHPTNYKTRGRGKLAECNDFKKVEGDDRPFDPSPFVCSAPLVAIFGANFFCDKLPAGKKWIVWDKKGYRLGRNDSADCEFIWTNQTGASRIITHVWYGMIKESEKQEKREHPTQKPVQLLIDIIEELKVPKKGLIVDFFCGSGSTLKAAKRLGHPYIGFDCEQQYVDIAKKGLAQISKRLI